MAGFDMYEDLFIVIDIQTAPGRYCKLHKLDDNNSHRQHR